MAFKIQVKSEGYPKEDCVFEVNMPTANKALKHIKQVCKNWFTPYRMKKTTIELME